MAELIRKFRPARKAATCQAVQRSSNSSLPNTNGSSLLAEAEKHVGRRRY